MFDFRKKILNPLIGKVIGKLDEALKAEGVAEKAERLLAVREAVQNNFNDVLDNERTKILGTLILTLGGFVIFATAGLTLLGFAAATVAVGAGTMMGEFHNRLIPIINSQNAGHSWISSFGLR
jgi:hypothetical protein